MATLKIVKRDIKDLIPAEYNPRQLSAIQYEDIKKSLLAFGIVDPVIVNMSAKRKNTIIGGHQRAKIWADLGHKTIPTVEVSLTLAKERELNVRLNKNTGSFDFDGLANNFEVEELTEWGFEDYELGLNDTIGLDKLSASDIDYESLISNPNKDSTDRDNINNAIIKLNYDQITYSEINNILKSISQEPETIFINAVKVEYERQLHTQ